MQWSADGSAIYFRHEGELPLPVLRYDLARARAEVWKELMPADRAGVIWVEPLVTPDGRAYVYNYYRLLSDLYLVYGLK